MPTATRSKPKTKASGINSPGYKINNMSNTAVEKATGKTWPQWIKALDAAGCAKMDHKQIVSVVSKKFDVGPWWQQMVTVGYEQARGLRAVHQKVDGYSSSVSKTIAASAKDVFDAWVDESRRRKWMKPAKFTVTTATPHKSIRIKWDADDTRVNVGIYPKGARKCQVTIEHNKLKDEAWVAWTKKCWAGCLADLEEYLVKS
jgi:hypothetical protein